ncbi:MAG: HAMP domain-containing histidine kinase [Elusimicrobia bacterium]|nr:HAMP domain-containing histidine kinase [Elusimicrobiota bacterium]
MSSRAPRRDPRALLYGFIYGSLVVLLVCLCAAALWFSSAYLAQERARADISSQQLSQFFDFENRAISEEMWTRNYEAIRLRVGNIARQIGNADYELVLADERGGCVYAWGVDCQVPDTLRREIPRFRAGPMRPALRFDPASGRYRYMVPLYIGAVHKGYLYAALSDPYEFYHGGRVGFALKVFITPIAMVVLLWLAWLAVSHRVILRPYLSALVEMEKHRALGELAAQVAHDIRSPLVALKGAIGSFHGLEEPQRRLVTAASSRIENIANGLLARFTGGDVADPEPFSFVAPVIDSIVAEKTALLGERAGIEIRRDLPEDLGAARVPVSATELSRVLSNLLNNAIEALKGQPGGVIVISARCAADRVRVQVKDDGKGIAPEVLEKLRVAGGSYEKAGGIGLGLHHAKAMLARAGGSLDIQSAPGAGTKVTLDMPSARPPQWCAQAIDLSDALTVVVLDDDPSVRLLWKQRLGEEGVVALTDPEQFEVSRFPPETTRYIFDYEICGSPVTGLDLIVSHKLARRAVLVTSYFNEPRLQRLVQESGTLMLPKFMIGSVRIEQRAGREAAAKAGRPGPRASCDAVLIDDDPLVRLNWRTAASRAGKTLRDYPGVPEFLAEAGEVDPRTPIYLDQELGNGSKGTEEALRINECGFTEIYLTTGHSAANLRPAACIRDVIGKEPPWLQPA